jgi:hypothetical protein
MLQGRKELYLQQETVEHESLGMVGIHLIIRRRNAHLNKMRLPTSVTNWSPEHYVSDKQVQILPTPRMTIGGGMVAPV